MGPALPDLPSTPPRTPVSRSALVIGAMFAVIALLVGVLAFVWVRKTDESVAATAPTTTSTSKPPGTTTSSTAKPKTTTTDAPVGTTKVAPSTVPSGPLPSKAELDAVVKELQAFNEQHRGLPYKNPVTVELLPDNEFNARLLEGFVESEDSLKRSERALKALGLIDAKMNLVETMKSVLSSGVLGFYDPKTKALVVRGHELTPYTKQTMDHELVHALDDQYYNLNRPEFDTAKDESSFGFSAIAEGNARRIENEYVAAMSPADKRARDKEEVEFSQAQGAILTDAPPVLLNLLQAPYELGPPLVKAVLAAGGNDLLGEAFAMPPTTSSQVIHPKKFLSHEAAVPVDKPKAEGKETDDAMFGELMTVITLNDSNPTTAAKAADGWAGDWYVVWDGGKDNPCIRIDYKLATPRDLDELKAAYDAWAKVHKGAVIEKKGDILEVTRCASGGGGGPSPF